jgi:hypothetical protein
MSKVYREVFGDLIDSTRVESIFISTGVSSKNASVSRELVGRELSAVTCPSVSALEACLSVPRQADGRQALPPKAVKVILCHRGSEVTEYGIL